MQNLTSKGAGAPAAGRRSGALGRALRPVAAAVAAMLLAAGCSVAPVYQKPQLDLPAYKEAPSEAESAQWKRAEPSDAVARGRWWTVFADPGLDRLVDEAMANNVSLAVALARLRQSRALVQGSEAARWPQLEAGVGATRLRASPASLGLEPDADVPARTVYRAQLGASYEVDLFGRVASSVAAARADAEQAEQLLQSLRLTLQADVAQAWLLLRGLQAEIALLDDTVGLRAQALALVERRSAAGEVAELEVARSRTELSVARAEALALRKRQAELQHALALLVGKTPAEVTLQGAPLAFTPLAVPAGLPSALLERRPDVAAAERAMAAANARIGIARAAWFPRLSISALLGLESASAGDLFQHASRTWALGPLAGTALAMTVFDGGRREADNARAIAAFDETAASYRQTVLNAVREVEDGLSGLRWLSQQSEELARSVASAQRAAQLSGLRWRAGHVNQLELIDAERQVLATQRAATQVERERALATVALIRALGGAWGPSAPATRATAGSSPDVAADAAAAPVAAGS